jgi:hypothetical protein
MGALECVLEYDHEVESTKYLEAFRQRKNLDQLGRLGKLQMQQLQRAE